MSGKITFNQVIVDAIGLIVSPLVGLVVTPFALLAALFKKVQQCYYNAQVGDQRKDFEKYDADLTERDVSWLKSEKERLKSLDDADHWLLAAKKAALAVIPIYGYLTIKNEEPPSIPSNESAISWCKWHIDLLEGRLQRDSINYLLGVNLSDE